MSAPDGAEGVGFETHGDLAEPTVFKTARAFA